MFKYPYTRTLLPAPKNYYDIGYNNPGADPPIVEPSLNGEIFAAIAKKSIVRCNNGSCKILFEIELTAEEKTTLDQVVADHKAAA